MLTPLSPGGHRAENLLETKRDAQVVLSPAWSWGCLQGHECRHELVSPFHTWVQVVNALQQAWGAGGGFTPQQRTLLPSPEKAKGHLFRDTSHQPSSVRGRHGYSKGCPSTSSIGVSPVGEPPDVSEAHAVSDAGEEEIQPPRPVPSVFRALRAQVPVLAAGAHQELWCHRLSKRVGDGRGQLSVEGRNKRRGEEQERGMEC